jgi:hypothetical protein
MEQTPWEAKSHSAIQEILRLSWNPKVHDRGPGSLELVPVLGQMNPISQMRKRKNMKSNIIFNVA